MPPITNDHLGAPEPITVSFVAYAKKAFVAGGTAAVAAAGSSIGLAFSDGAVSQGDILAIVLVTVGAFFATFGTTFSASNTPRP